jgi:conjugal transfer pilus assembly protein TraW
VRVPVSDMGLGLVLSAMVLVTGSSPIAARDYGNVGQTFPVIETDLLATIETRLRRAEASGELARVNAQFAKRAEEKVKRPTPVPGLSVAERGRTWDFDPTVTIQHDVRDQKGNLIAAAGQRVNPLDFVVIRQDLVFVDGDDPAQLDWATGRYADAGAKIIFVNGSPFEAMSREKRRFYFDQEGKLTRKFGIEHIPAVVTRAGRVMRVSEIVLSPKKAG